MILAAVLFIVLALIHSRCAIAQEINVTIVYIDVAIYVISAIAIIKYFL